MQIVPAQLTRLFPAKGPSKVVVEILEGFVHPRQLCRASPSPTSRSHRHIAIILPHNPSF